MAFDPGLRPQEDSLAFLLGAAKKKKNLSIKPIQEFYFGQQLISFESAKYFDFVLDALR